MQKDFGGDGDGDVGAPDAGTTTRQRSTHIAPLFRQLMSIKGVEDKMKLKVGLLILCFLTPRHFRRNMC